jgi:hypothetical protein
VVHTLVEAFSKKDRKAFAAVVFRMATFYIPAGERFFALRWLKSGDYV